MRDGGPLSFSLTLHYLIPGLFHGRRFLVRSSIPPLPSPTHTHVKRMYIFMVHLIIRTHARKKTPI